MLKAQSGQELVFINELQINATRRKVYVSRIIGALERIRVIDGHDALKLATDLVDSFDFALQNHLAEWSRVELKPFVGVGTQKSLRVRGRIAERSKVALPTPQDEPFDILVSCWYRFLIHSQTPTPILIKRGPHEVLTCTDEEGFFDSVISAQPELGDLDFVVDVTIGDQATIRADGTLCRQIVPQIKAPRCVLVDIDGLILNHPSDAFSQVLGELVLGEFQPRRRAVENLDVFLSSLAEGNPVPCPIFYLSHAPRHLYTHLQAAISFRSLPAGYLHLRDYDMQLRQAIAPANLLEMWLAHDLVDMFPEQRFVCVGSRRRSEAYEPLIKALGHRLDGIFLVGSEATPESIAAVAKGREVPIYTGLPNELRVHAISREWARE